MNVHCNCVRKCPCPHLFLVEAAHKAVECRSAALAKISLLASSWLHCCKACVTSPRTVTIPTATFVVSDYDQEGLEQIYQTDACLSTPARQIATEVVTPKCPTSTTLRLVGISRSRGATILAGSVAVCSVDASMDGRSFPCHKSCVSTFHTRSASKKYKRF